MSAFAFDVNDDQPQIGDGVRYVAAGVIRPAVDEGDEREETPWSIDTIFEGTSEIQRLLISRAISGVYIP